MSKHNSAAAKPAQPAQPPAKPEAPADKPSVPAVETAGGMDLNGVPMRSVHQLEI